MNIRQRFCRHNYIITSKSNAIQSDGIGDPLKLFAMKCTKCGHTCQQWVNVNLEKAIADLDSGDLVLVEWEDY